MERTKPTTLGEARQTLMPAGVQHSSELDASNWMAFTVQAGLDFSCSPAEVDAMPDDTPLGVSGLAYFGYIDQPEAGRVHCETEKPRHKLENLLYLYLDGSIRVLDRNPQPALLAVDTVVGTWAYARSAFINPSIEGYDIFKVGDARPQAWLGGMVIGVYDRTNNRHVQTMVWDITQFINARASRG